MENFTNIIKIALSTKFNSADIDSIIAVAEATENVNVAISILLGTYKEPALGKCAGDSETGHNRTFLRYDRFTDKVYFTFKPVSVKKAWFKKETTELTKENAVSFESWESKAVEELKCEDYKELRDSYKYEIYETTVSDKVSESYMTSQKWQEECQKYLDCYSLE